MELYTKPVGNRRAPASKPPSASPLMIPAERTDGVEAFLVIARQFLWIVVVSCLVTGCLASFSDRIPIDPATVADLRRQVPVYSESDRRS